MPPTNDFEKKTISIGWDVKSESYQIEKCKNRKISYMQARQKLPTCSNRLCTTNHFKKLKKANIDEFKYKKGCKNHSNHLSKQNDLADMLSAISNNIEEHLIEKEGSILNKKKIDEWKLMAIILDRFLFWIFTALTVISSVILLVVLPVMKNQGLIG